MKSIICAVVVSRVRERMKSSGSMGDAAYSADFPFGIAVRAHFLVQRCTRVLSPSARPASTKRRIPFPACPPLSGA